MRIVFLRGNRESTDNIVVHIGFTGLPKNNTCNNKHQQLRPQSHYRLRPLATILWPQASLRLKHTKKGRKENGWRSVHDRSSLGDHFGRKEVAGAASKTSMWPKLSTEDSSAIFSTCDWSVTSLHFGRSDCKVVASQCERALATNTQNNKRAHSHNMLSQLITDHSLWTFNIVSLAVKIYTYPKSI